MLHRLAHLSEAALGLEGVGVVEDGLLLRAVLAGDAVHRVDALDVHLAVLNDFAVLNVDSADFGQVTRGCAVGGEELSYLDTSA